MNTYFAIEIQNSTMTVNAYDNLADAQSKYHTILSYAAKSDVEIHGAMCMDNRGNNMEPPKVFEHPAQEA